NRPLPDGSSNGATMCASMRDFAGLIFAAIAVPPWLRPWWIRWIFALLLALIDAYIFGWGDAPSLVSFLPTIGGWGWWNF
ncbi:MAG: hypothetical protein QOK08_824, partial [Actinomycetota bacterium]|nr:hypothetical protein [Actinomycetota bacterium]